MSLNLRLKIGFVLDGGLEKPDGVQQYILALGEWFKGEGHEVKYLVAGEVPADNPDAVSLAANFKVISNGNRLKIPLPANRFKLKAYLQREQFDVLHVQTPYSPLMGGQLISLSASDTAIIGTYHVVPNTWILKVGNWLLGKWCYFTLKRFDKMFSVSTAAQAVARQDFGIESEVLPNVINYERFNLAKPLEAYSDDKLTILFLGRLVPRKGCQVLLEAVKLLDRSDLPDFRVVIAGSGPLEDHLKDYVKKNNLSDLVEFKGYIDETDKPSLYASADISVFPSSGGESFGIVLIEAMASGQAAVLAGNNVGYSSVMAEQPGLLFNPKDSRELSALLAQYLKDSKLRNDAAKWGETYTKRFDVAVVGTKLLQAYRDALRKYAK